MDFGMQCPSCEIGIDLRIASEQLYMPSDTEGISSGYNLINGHCPKCSQFIVILQHVSVVNSIFHSADYGESLNHDIQGILFQKTIYPFVAFSRKVDPAVPESYKDDFLESCAVLPISPKASAAISRRLLQNILRDHFKIVHRDLFDEIEEFIKTQNAPSLLNKEIDAIRKIGNFAAHPLKSTSTGLVVAVEPGEAEWLIEVLEDLFDFAFVKPKEAEEKLKRLAAKLQDITKPPKKKS